MGYRIYTNKDSRLMHHASGMRSYVHASLTVISVAGALSHADRRLDPLCPSLALRTASIDW
jgi:hypothetical protein